MGRASRGCSWRSIVFAATVAALIAPLAGEAKESPASLKSAEQYIANGNLKAAEIELRNAVREAPQDPSIRARLAAVYLQLGEPAVAEREARAARERNGAEADYLPVLADALLRQGKFSELLDTVKPGDRAPALESKVRLAIGAAALGAQDRKTADAMLHDAVRLDPSAVPPKIALARFVVAKEPAEADKLIDAAIAADPHSVEALQVKGEILRARGDVAGAMKNFDQALKINPKSVPVLLSRADLNIAQGNYAAADADLNPILKAAPNNFTANFLRGVELAKQQKYAEADRFFDKISPAFSRVVFGYYLQGATKLALGQNAQAEGILAKYLAAAPNDLRAARLAATAALRQRAPVRAIDYLKPVIDKNPPDAAALTLLGNAYMAAGKPALALQQFEKAGELEPDNPQIKTRAAISEMDSGQGKAGLAALEKVFDTEAGATVAGPTLVLTLLRTRQIDKAAEVAASLIKRDATNPLYQTLLGAVRMAQKDNAAAETAFRAALAKDPEFVPAVRDLAQLYKATGRADEARKLYTDRLAKKPGDVAALLGLADLAAADKKWSEATDYINRARTAAPNDPTPGLALVRLYELRQDWPNAKAVASALSAQFPSDVNIFDALGRSQLGAGDVNGAISSFKRAYELAPNSTPILARYLALLNSAKYYREAQAVLQAAIDRDPQNVSLKGDLIRVTAEADGLDAAIVKAHGYAKDNPNTDVYDIIAAQLYEGAGRVSDAISLLEKDAAAKPASDGLATFLSRLYIRTGDFAKAEAVLQARLKTDPNSAAARSVLAPLYAATNRVADARKVYQEMVAKNPNDVTGLVGLADLAISEKKWDEAEALINKARAAAPNDPLPGVKLASLYAFRQDWKKAIAITDELVAKFPTNLDVLDTRARAQIAAGDTPGAIATYKAAYEAAPKSPPIRSRYVTILGNVKKYPEERTVLQQALAADPQNVRIKADLIRVEYEISGLDAALAKARDFAKSDPDNSLYDVVEAELFDKANRQPEAQALLEKALAAKPKDDRLVIALAREYAATKDTAKAEALLSRRLQDDPANFAVRSALAALYLGARNNDAAIAEYDKLIKAKPGDPVALNNLAWLYQQKGDLAKARQLAERAVAAAPRAPQIDDTMGWILLAQGDAEKALTYLAAANVSAPRDPSIQYHLAVALNKVGRAADAQAMLEKLLGSDAAFADRAEAEKLLQQLKRG
jgi:putative PEP-CTERM system TPR-repeat lipoprotein